MLIRKHTLARPDGTSIAETLSGKKIEADTRQCCHCGRHWDYIPGSGRTRGWCLLCNKITCGAVCCHEHFPVEERMDLYEKGLLPEFLSPREAILPPHLKIDRK